MNANELLYRARRAGITIELCGDQIKVTRPKGSNTDQILGEIKANKPAVLVALTLWRPTLHDGEATGRMPNPPPRAKQIRYQCGAGVTPCGAPARLYPCGWRCDTHKPGQGVYPASRGPAAGGEMP